MLKHLATACICLLSLVSEITLDSSTAFVRADLMGEVGILALHSEPVSGDRSLKKNVPASENSTPSDAPEKILDLSTVSAHVADPVLVMHFLIYLSENSLWVLSTPAYQSAGKAPRYRPPIV